MKKIIVAIFITFIVAGCASVKVTSDYDTTVDFTQYNTYEYFGWAKESNKILNQLEQTRIEEAFGKELGKRGLKYVDKGSGGDLIVTLYVVTEQKTSTTANTTTMGGVGYGGFYGYGPAYGWGGNVAHSTTTYSQHEYTVGTLIIDIYDAKEKKLIWEGVGSGTVKEAKSPEKRQENIEYAVSKIMEEYPVKPTQD